MYTALLLHSTINSTIYTAAVSIQDKREDEILKLSSYTIL